MYPAKDTNRTDKCLICGQSWCAAIALRYGHLRVIACMIALPACSEDEARDDDKD